MSRPTSTNNRPIQVITINSDDEHDFPDPKLIPDNQRNNNNYGSAVEMVKTSSRYGETVEVINVDSSDEDHQESSNVTKQKEKKQKQVCVSEYNLSKTDYFSDVYTENAKENVGSILESETTVDKNVMKGKWMNTDSPDNTKNKTAVQKLELLAKSLEEVLAKKPKIPKLTNVEKVIFDVSQSNFDITDHFHTLISKRCNESQSNKIKRSKRQRKKRNSHLELNDYVPSYPSHTDSEDYKRPPIRMKLTKSGNSYNITSTNGIPSPESKEPGGDGSTQARNDGFNPKYISEEIPFSASQSTINEKTPKSTCNYNCNTSFEEVQDNLQKNIEQPTIKAIANNATSIDQEVEITKAELITCYHRIFDERVLKLCTKMGDLILSLLKEEKAYKQQIVGAGKDANNKKEVKEKEILNTSFLISYYRYKTTFSKLFQDIHDIILSKASAVKLQKMMLLLWCVSLLAKQHIPLPDLFDNLITVWHKIKDLLSDFQSPVMTEVFILSDTDFKIELDTVLDYIVAGSTNFTDSIPGKVYTLEEKNDQELNQDLEKNVFISDSIQTTSLNPQTQNGLQDCQSNCLATSKPETITNSLVSSESVQLVKTVIERKITCASDIVSVSKEHYENIKNLLQKNKNLTVIKLNKECEFDLKIFKRKANPVNNDTRNKAAKTCLDESSMCSGESSIVNERNRQDKSTNAVDSRQIFPNGPLNLPYFTTSNTMIQNNTFEKSNAKRKQPIFIPVDKLIMLKQDKYILDTAKDLSVSVDNLKGSSDIKEDFMDNVGLNANISFQRGCNNIFHPDTIQQTFLSRPDLPSTVSKHASSDVDNNLNVQFHPHTNQGSQMQNSRNNLNLNKTCQNQQQSSTVNVRDSNYPVKEIASGNLAFSKVPSEEICEDPVLSLVPEVLPKETLQYKPSLSNKF